MSLEQIGMAIMGLFVLVAIVVCVADGEAKPKDNVRLPRTPSWDRAAKFYQDIN